MHHAADYTPYEGHRVKGWPVMTLVRGKIACEEGKITGSVGDGQFLKRGYSAFVK